MKNEETTTTETPEETPVKFLVKVQYKGNAYDKGSTASLAPHLAERLLGQGHVEIINIDDTPKGKKK